MENTVKGRFRERSCLRASFERRGDRRCEVGEVRMAVVPTHKCSGRKYALGIGRRTPRGGGGRRTMAQVKVWIKVVKRWLSNLKVFAWDAERPVAVSAIGEHHCVKA
jgi:hypothetical protein